MHNKKDPKKTGPFALKSCRDLALKASFLADHIFNNDVVDFSECGTVFKHLPGLVGVEMNLYKLLVSHREQAVALKMLGEIVVDNILVKIFSFTKPVGAFYDKETADRIAAALSRHC